ATAVSEARGLTARARGNWVAAPVARRRAGPSRSWTGARAAAPARSAPSPWRSGPPGWCTQRPRASPSALLPPLQPTPRIGPVWRFRDLEHDPEKARPALDAGWEPVFGKDHAPGLS